MAGSDIVNPHAARGENERKVMQHERSPHIFRPITFRSVTARNRIMVSPMCQYSADDGVANDWHFQHLGCRAVGGAGIVFTEVVHTEPRGRITAYCLGLWNNVQRPGNAIDTTIDNGEPSTRPAFNFNTTSFWAQGLNLGFECKF